MPKHLKVIFILGFVALAALMAVQGARSDKGATLPTRVNIGA